MSGVRASPGPRSPRSLWEPVSPEPGSGVPASLRRVALVLLPVLCLTAWGCGDGGASGEARVGDPAPEYSVSALDDDSLSLDELEGRPVLLNFWATWCAPCRRETPFLQSLHERHRDAGLQVVGVSMDSRGSVPDIRAFVEEYGVTYRILHDPRQTGMERFSIMGLPATFVLDRDGRIVFARIGPVSEDDAEFRSALRDVVS